MVTIAGYKISEAIYVTSQKVIYRGVRLTDEKPVIIKSFGSRYCAPEEIFRFKHEYEITKNLSISGIIKPIELLNDRHKPVLILEDIGGVSLKQYLNEHQLYLIEFFKIAIQLVDTLGKLHQHNLIHKDIKPSNIIINPDNLEVRITDFALATQLSIENPRIASPELLEGTLAYMSPEQTGRMNRSIDYRTDFYSLGVTFYEMLTNQLPCHSDDLMELVHCHIARMPTPLNEINRKIPKIVSDIVIKLITKTAEERYQSAFGLKTDLEQCLIQWEEKGEISDFTIASKDFSDQLQIPQKLYGREKELAKLLAAFERVCSVKTEMMLVAGYSGVGKSALVQEIQKPLVKYRGYFISGKFDQFKRNIPYSALIQAFSELMRQLVAESKEKIAVWKSKLLEGLGENGQVIIDVIPEVELIIGKQPEVVQLGPTESQNRFNSVFQNFINIIANKEHPLVLFLDDLQWADLGSLKLIESIMNDGEQKSLLLIGAYRDNEVNPTHPTIQTIEKIQQAGAVINQIVLEPLNLENVLTLVTDTLVEADADSHSTQSERSVPLAELVFNKTQGNPFFLTTLLSTLYAEKLLKFDFTQGRWLWDIRQIQGIGITDYNVVELVARNIQKLSESTQGVLKLAACIGNTFNLDTLAIVNEKSLVTTADELWGALQAGLILPLSPDYKIPLFIDELEQKYWQERNSRVSYKFLHDRVQQAAYFLIPDPQKKQTHLKIGELLLKNIPKSEIEENIFDIVNQLNIGIEFVTEEVEKEELAKLNLMAGKKALAANAYDGAVRYLNVGLQLLPADSWENRYELTRDIFVETAGAEYLNINFERAKQLSDVVLERAKTLLEKIPIYETKIQFYIAQNQMQEAIDTALPVLNLLGVRLPKNPSTLHILLGLIRTKLVLSRKRIEDLANLPEMTDSYKLAAMGILMKITSPVFMASPAMFPLIIFAMLNLGIKYGNCSYSALAYVIYGLLLCGSLGDIESGYQFGQLALQIIEKYDAQKLKPIVYVTFNSGIRQWKEPAIKSIQPFVETILVGLEVGDIEYACHNARYYCSYPFLTGEHLESLAQKQAKYLKMLLNFQQEIQINYTQIWSQVVLNLLGVSTDKCHLVGEMFNEDEKLPNFLKNNNVVCLFHFYFLKAGLLYLFKEYAQSVEQAKLAEKYIEGGFCSLPLTAHNFYYSLALLALCSNSSNQQKRGYLKKVVSNQKKLKKWAFHAPGNYQHKYELVEAEKARVLGEDIRAIKYYDRAIKGASEQGYIQEEALANELAAEFYLACGREKIAQTYLTDAYYCYVRWGAKAKVKDLEERYPYLVIQTQDSSITSIPTITSLHNSTSRAYSDILDFTTIIKSSQTIAGEVVLDNLLIKLIKIVIENAGANTGILLLERQGELFVEAIGTSANEQVSVRQSTPINNSQQLPLSLINYVFSTKEDVVLNNAYKEGRFTKDSYIQEYQTKSILCTPILGQGKLIGILYLENNLAIGAFTPARLQLLKLLCSQAAISIENAQLYEEQKEYAETLERKVLERTQALHQSEEKFSTAFRSSPNSIAITRVSDGHYIEVNDTFCRIFGYTREEVIGCTTLELNNWVNPEDRVRMRQELLDKGAIRNWELDFRIKSGELKTMLVSAEIIDLGGESCILSASNDITDRKQIEQALRESEERYRAVIEDQTELIYRFKPNGILTFVNDAYCRYFNKKRSDLIGSNFMPVIPEEDQLKIKQNLASLNQDNPIVNIEHRVIFGKLQRWQQWTDRAIFDENGNLIEFQAVGIDISDRKQAEEALRESQRALFTLMSNLPGMAYRNLYDEHWTMEFVSEGCFELTGYLPEDLIGNRTISYEEMTHPEDRASVRYAIESAVISRQPFELVYRIITATGEPKWVWEKGQGIFSSSREPLALEGFITDINDRKQAEEALQKALATADAASRAKGEFLSKMSHELRTPLNAILGFTQVLARDNTITGQQQEYLGIISRSGEHLLTLINDVLEMSKIEAGRIELHENSFDLYRLLNSLEEMFRLKAETKGLQLIFDYNPNLPQYIKTDESKLRQVLINLLGNAIKFTERGGVALRAKKEERETAKQNIILFEIEDTGLGIAPEEFDQLFDPFGQTETGRKSQSGTGLGLPISRQFVQLMGGDITFSSTLEKGTIFKFFIQFNFADNGEIQTRKSNKKVISLAPNQPTYRILIVDDKWESRLLLVNLLSPLGFQLREAANGQEAVTIWENWQPHLIWMDMQMPVMDGYQATKQIKAQLTSQATVIIALTASAFEEHKAIVISVGCDDFVSKPFREEVIFEKMAEHLRISYLYEEKDCKYDAKIGLPSKPTVYEIKSEDLATIPAEWITQLYQAARELDEELLGQLIEQIRHLDAAKANALADLVKKLRFDRIINLIHEYQNG
ncbi:MAG TPA: PAS domain S-box protein [Leptolyngbyaceae cyanobacterium]